MQRNMELRGLSGNELSISILYGADGTAKYLLGVTDTGYIILERESYTFHEAGECNPYADYMDAKKYYGGPLCYYTAIPVTQSRNTDSHYSLYDILQKETTNIVVQLEFHEQLCSKTAERASASGSGDVRVANSYSYIRRRAFGYNDSNTCSAVAAAIALNYLALQYNTIIVPSKWKSELFNNSIPSDAQAAKTLFPKADALYEYLVDICGMGAASFGSRITKPLVYYIANNVPGGCGLNVSWTISPKASTIKNKIDNNLPVLVTTTAAGPYTNHTMLAYGYRDNSETELLVHLGWYNKTYIRNSGKDLYYAEIWINESYVTFGHYFSIVT